MIDSAYRCGENTRLVSLVNPGVGPLSKPSPDHRMLGSMKTICGAPSARIASIARS